jgi:hypothetical protein
MTNAEHQLMLLFHELCDGPVSMEQATRGDRKPDGLRGCQKRGDGDYRKSG